MDQLNMQELCTHLGVDDERTALKITASFGVTPRPRFEKKDHYWFSWDNLFRMIHAIEPSCHGDLLEDLKRPLLHFADLAGLLRKSPEALRKDIARGKLVLPPAIHLTDRTRAWRRRDIEHWLRDDPLPTYTPFVMPAPAETKPIAEAVAERTRTDVTEQSPGSGNAPGTVEFSLFGDILDQNAAIKLAHLTANTDPISTAA